MKPVEELSREDLETVVDTIRGRMYFDLSGWNPDKTWSPETLDQIAECLDEYGLVPKEVS